MSLWQRAQGKAVLLVSAAVAASAGAGSGSSPARGRSPLLETQVWGTKTRSCVISFWYIGKNRAVGIRRPGTAEEPV